MSDLQNKVANWRKYLKDGATGPLIVAHEIVALSEDWETYREEAGGLSCSTWLGKVIRPGAQLQWWKRRALAVDTLGNDIKSRIHHDVAVYVVGSVPESNRPAVMTALFQGAHKQNGTPLAPSQARRVINKMLDLKPRPRVYKACGRCAEFRAALVAAGVPIPA